MVALGRLLDSHWPFLREPILHFQFEAEPSGCLELCARPFVAGLVRVCCAFAAHDLAGTTLSPGTRPMGTEFADPPRRGDRLFAALCGFARLGRPIAGVLGRTNPEFQ